MTLEECNLLGSKLGTHKISPIQFKNEKDVQKLKEFNAEISRFDSIQDLGLLRLMRMVPGLDPRVIIEGIKIERIKWNGQNLDCVSNAIFEEAA